MTYMLNDHLKAVMERAAELPAPIQEEIAGLIEEALERMAQPVPRLSPEWQAAVERVMREQHKSLEYLKDK